MYGYAGAALSMRLILMASAARMKIIVHDSLSSFVLASGGVSRLRVLATSHIASLNNSKRLIGLLLDSEL